MRETLPPLAAESLQTPCGYHPPPWFSAYARTLAAKIGFAFSFVQSMCDMADCMQLIKEHEVNARGGLKFETLARLRLDLAWEAPLYWPPSGLVPNAVHTPRMNTKAGINDKFALGYRDAMEVYLTRLHAIAAANVLYTKHQQFANHSLLKHNHSSGGLLPYEKSEIKRMISFKCRGRSGGGISMRPRVYWPTIRVAGHAASIGRRAAHAQCDGERRAHRQARRPRLSAYLHINLRVFPSMELVAAERDRRVRALLDVLQV